MIKKVVCKLNNATSCIVCGTDNPASLHARYFVLDDESVVGIMQADEKHQSYPGRVHGGMISALLDESMGRSINALEPETWCVTVEMTTQFKRPVPCHEKLLVTGRVIENSRRIFTAEGQIILKDGTVAAISKGKYIKMPLSRIADTQAESEKFEVYKLPDDPNEIDFPE